MSPETAQEFPTLHKTRPITRIARPFQNFMKDEATSGIFLISSVVIALFWSNSPLQDTYFEVWNTKFSITLGSFSLSKSIVLWIDEFLMSIFFLLIGLEIKRELLIGELSSVKRAGLPVIAAFGGMILPALIYLMFNPPGSEGVRGWAIPMATDIAFALGILYLLGKRVPTSLRIFLTSVAIVDDIGAVLVIAFFYSEGIKYTYLYVALLILFFLIVLNRIGVRSLAPYLLLGFFLWYNIFQSGVHATLAGVLLAFTLPATTLINYDEFKDISNDLMTRLNKAVEVEDDLDRRHLKIYQNTIQTLEKTCEDVEAPLQKLEHSIAPLVTFMIMPLFALSNGGVILNQFSFASFGDPIVLGIIFGLFIGKPLGILLFTYSATRLNLVALPPQISWYHILGVSLLAGIGFTMAIFIGGLAFPVSLFPFGSKVSLAKMAILTASFLSMVGGIAVLVYTDKKISR